MTVQKQQINIVISSLMGIVFGCSIVYILSRLIAAQRRITALEHEISRKVDEQILKKELKDLETSTKEILVNLSTQILNVLPASE